MSHGDAHGEDNCVRVKKDALLRVTARLGITSLFICTHLHGVRHPTVLHLRLPATNPGRVVRAVVVCMAEHREFIVRVFRLQLGEGCQVMFELHEDDARGGGYHQCHLFHDFGQCFVCSKLQRHPDPHARKIGFSRQLASFCSMFFEKKLSHDTIYNLPCESNSEALCEDRVRRLSEDANCVLSEAGPTHTSQCTCASSCRTTSTSEPNSMTPPPSISTAA